MGNIVYRFLVTKYSFGVQIVTSCFALVWLQRQRWDFSEEEKQRENKEEVEGSRRRREREEEGSAVSVRGGGKRGGGGGGGSKGLPPHRSQRCEAQQQRCE